MKATDVALPYMCESKLNGFGCLLFRYIHVHSTHPFSILVD